MSPRTLGITGGLGSGKSSVCRILERLGAEVFYADDEGKRLLAENPALRQEIVRSFGPESYLPDDSVNRSYLARTVFSNPENVARINALVHPRVFEAFEAKRRETHARLLVMEAALIYESGADRFLDAVAVVDAPEQDRVQRVVARDRSDPAAVQARMRYQLAPEVLRARADYIIENSGSIDELERQVREVFAAVTA